MRILSEFVNKDTKIITVEIGKNEEIQVKRANRSNKANAYFWELLQQLCYEMNIDVIQEYRKVEEIGSKTVINAYYGSSSYNSKQFSKLLDHLIQDCRSIGIQTLEDIEIEELIRREYESK